MKIGIDWGGRKIEAIAIDSKDGSELNRFRIDSAKDYYKEVINGEKKLLTFIEKIPFLWIHGILCCLN